MGNSVNMPIRTYQALKAIGLTDDQANDAWNIILKHLGIVSPDSVVSLPKKSKRAKLATEDIIDWSIDDEISIWHARDRKQKPKHAIKTTEMINEEIQRLKTESAPQKESTTTEKKIVRKNKNGQW